MKTQKLKKWQQKILEMTKNSDLNYLFTNKTRGGKRPNAGRPKGEPTTTISFRVKLKHEQLAKELLQELKEKIARYEKSNG